MFGLFKKTDVVDLFSICEGKVIPIEDVPDKVFAKKMLGDGCAFQLTGDTIYAPCDATVLMTAETKHAIGLKTKNGAEALIHVGLDTVNLQGNGLDLKVKAGDKVKKGQPLLKIDKDVMEKNHINLTTPLVISNIDDYVLENYHLNEEVKQQNKVLKIKKS